MEKEFQLTEATMAYMEPVLDNKKTSPQEKADGLNLLQAIFNEDNDLDDVVNAVINGTIPEVIKVKDS